MSTISSEQTDPREGYIPIENAALYYREIGQGQPVIILHGGPDFDHLYFLPDMDRLSGFFRLIYYDQRGRGKSAGYDQIDLLFREERLKKTGDDIEKLGKISATVMYQEGDPDAVAEYYRIQFGATIRQPEHLDRVMKSFRSSFTKEGILKAREAGISLMSNALM